MFEHRSSQALKLPLVPIAGDACKSKCELKFLASLFLMADFVTEAADFLTYLDFVLEHVLDCLSPTSAALWENCNEMGWVLHSKAGTEMALPPGWSAWTDLNQECFKRQRVTLIPTDSLSAKFQKPLHWVIPGVVPGASNYVLHVVGLSVPPCRNLFEPFLRVVAQNIVQFKISRHPSYANLSPQKPSLVGPFLSFRQKEVLSFLALDLTYNQISKRMGFSESTIKQEAMKIFKILGVSNRSEAVQQIVKRADGVQKIENRDSRPKF